MTYFNFILSNGRQFRLEIIDNRISLVFPTPWFCSHFFVRGRTKFWRFTKHQDPLLPLHTCYKFCKKKKKLLTRQKLVWRWLSFTYSFCTLPDIAFSSPHHPKEGNITRSHKHADTSAHAKRRAYKFSASATSKKKLGVTCGFFSTERICPDAP